MLLLILICILSSGLAIAGSEEKVEGLVKEIKVTQKKLAHEDKFRRKVMGSLYGINQKMKKITEKKSELTDQMLGARREVSLLAQQIVRLEEKIEGQKVKISKYIRAAYALRGRSTVQALLESESLRDFDRTLHFLKIFADRDYKVIQEYKSNIKTLQAKREKMNAEVQNLVQIRSDIQKQESHLTEQQDSKIKLLNRLRAERKKQLERIKSLRVKSQDLEGEIFGSDILEMLEASVYEKKGQLQPPVQGAVVQGFGIITDEDYQFSISHKGIHFGVPPGSEVRAIYRGKVAFAGFLPGYGPSVLVDHGDHYYSVYSFNQRLKVKRGDRVSEGTVIALSGEGSPHFGVGTYFEMRHFSDAIDPMPWLNLAPELRASSL